MELQDVLSHSFVIGGSVYAIRTGWHANGWWWDCAGLPAPDGPHPSREAALDHAIATIGASLRVRPN